MLEHLPERFVMQVLLIASVFMTYLVFDTIGFWWTWGISTLAYVMVAIMIIWSTIFSKYKDPKDPNGTIALTIMLPLLIPIVGLIVAYMFLFFVIDDFINDNVKKSED